MARFAPPVVVGEAVALDLREAGVGSRGIAFLIDFTIELALLAGLTLISAVLLSGSTDAAAVAAVELVLYVGVLLGYPVVWETLTRGRTPGKMVMGLRAVRDDGGPIRFRHAFVRGLLGLVVEKPGITLCGAALVSMLVTTRSKRLGDLLAGSVVLHERVPRAGTAEAWVPPPLSGWAATLDLTAVDDELAMELRTFLTRVRGFTPSVAQQIGDRLTAELSARVGPPPPGTPPWAYLTAVLGERRRRAALAPPPDAGVSSYDAVPTWSPAPAPPASMPLPETVAPPEASPPRGPFAPPR